MDEMVLSRFQVWPNPAQDYFVLAFSLDEPTMLRISLIDLLGQEVRLLEEGLRAQGQHSLRYTTSGLVPGIYLLRTESPLQVHLERLLVR